jgi:O-antigen/teichoic acid export membrane protein
MEVRHFTGGMLATAALALLLTQSDKLLLSRILSLEAFGYYTLATLVSNSLYQVVGPITQALYPRLTELAAQEDAIDLANTYHLGAQLMSVFLIPPALLLLVFGRDLLQVWTGDMALALQVAPVLALLALGTLLNGLMGIPHMLQLAHGWSGFAARLNLIAVVLLLPLIVWVAPRYGAIGTAWVWVALNTGYVVVGIHCMHRRLLPREKWRWYWYDTALPALPAVGIMALSQLLHPAGLGQLMQWCWLLGTTALAWLAAGMGASAIRQRVPKIWST